MPKINVLPKSVAELIAAGEVVERPASAIKEMAENAIDAGATKLTVEIRNGGVTFIRITDDGCGIFPEDVGKAFMRHATSKISESIDLDSIATLGFRGEALAAISAVSRVEMLTKPREIDLGTRIVIEGGEELLIEEAGCADGTVITVRDIFYNTPARMKFLKKDVTEANAVAAVMDRIALSHPEVAVKLVRDGSTVLSTPGNGKLSDAVYAVCGKDYASGLIPFDGESESIRASGFTCLPTSCRPTRNGQFVFLNGRFVRSGTVAAALDAAYKNSAMTGKYPYAVVCLSMPYGAVDVNVHPAKTEVRFSDERRVFNAVYYAVKAALAAGDRRPTATVGQARSFFSEMSAAEYVQTAVELPTTAAAAKGVEAARTTPADIASLIGRDKGFSAVVRREERSAESGLSVAASQGGYNGAAVAEVKHMAPTELPPIKSADEPSEAAEPTDERAEFTVINEPEPEIRVVGEVFMTYIIAEKGREMYLIDKHAAHERILFEELRKDGGQARQCLLTSETVTLSKEAYDAVITHPDELDEAGFEIEDFGNGTVKVRALPAMLAGERVSDLIEEIASALMSFGKASAARTEDIYHRIACRAAIKAGNRTTDLERRELACRILSDNKIMYCPHGRPVAIRITERELEKQFGRIQ